MTNVILLTFYNVRPLGLHIAFLVFCHDGRMEVADLPGNFGEDGKG
jgi:hypothetical protein